NGRLFGTVQELREIGIRTDDLPPAVDGYIALDGIDGLSYRYLEAAQQIRMTVDDTRRLPHVVDTMPRRPAAVTPGTGLLLSYDAYAQP
ncbi:hypothetical protein ABTK13_21125, partial [Acinetobacter baumannii]